MGSRKREDAGSGKFLLKWLQPDPAGTQEGKLHLRICFNLRQSETHQLLEGSNFPAFQAICTFGQNGCPVAREHAPNKSCRSGCWKEKNSKV